MLPTKNQQLLAKELLNRKMETLTKPVKLTRASSCVFNASFSLNPLVAAAAPILVAVNHIAPQAANINPAELHRILSHELQTFEEKARKLDYRAAIIMAARYFLCCHVDEMIAGSNAQALQDFWQQQPLLQTMQGETWGGERFFMILERASDDTKTHVHLLELGFLCLNLGYQGKYRKQKADHQELENIRENLFELIKSVRGQYSSTLYYREAQQTRSVMKTYRRKYRIPHLVAAAIILAVGIIAVYVPYHAHLKNVAKQVENAISKSP